jgi:hypothetical protein
MRDAELTHLGAPDGWMTRAHPPPARLTAFCGGLEYLLPIPIGGGGGGKPPLRPASIATAGLDRNTIVALDGRCELEILREEPMRRILAFTFLSLALLGGAAIFTMVDSARAVACDYHGS